MFLLLESIIDAYQMNFHYNVLLHNRLLINLSDEPLAKIDELCTGPLSELVTKNLKGDEGTSEYPTLNKYGEKHMFLFQVFKEYFARS